MQALSQLVQLARLACCSTILTLARDIHKQYVLGNIEINNKSKCALSWHVERMLQKKPWLTSYARNVRQSARDGLALADSLTSLS